MNIVFIDHDIDNWHARTFARLLAEDGSNTRLTGVYASRRDTLQEWADGHAVTAVDCVEELLPMADCVMVLAPSNPETHRELCLKAFSLGKPTFVDKTFAPNVETGQRLFDLADRIGIPVQSSSVLRYTEVQKYCWGRPGEVLKFIATRASGGNFETYLIHPVEHVVSLMGYEYHEVVLRNVAGFRQIDFNYSQGRAATIHMHVGHAAPSFSVVSYPNDTRAITIDNENRFRSGLKGILEFFRYPSHLIDRRETLAILQILQEMKALAAS